ncbi:MAG: F0F1 ATP synthase subunit B' [Candidatus Puniceispirillales bacterium WSBS_2018_MAG_OTU23]
MAYFLAVKRTFLAAVGMTIHTASAFAAGDSGGLPQLDFTTWPTQIFWLVVSFSLAYLLMSRIVTPSIASVLEDRHARLEDDMIRARESAGEAEQMRLAFEKTLMDARQESSDMAREATAVAVAEADKKNTAAAARLATKTGKSTDKIMEARKAALKELDDIAATSAIDAVARLTGIKITKADARLAVKAAAKALPSMEMEQR